MQVLLKYKIAFLLLALPMLAAAQTGTLKGHVSDKSKKEALIGVNILVKGTSSGTMTDENGDYSLKLKPGTYSLEISYVGYEEVVVTDVKITAAGTTVENIQMSEISIQGGEIEIIGDKPLIDVDVPRTERTVDKDKIEAAPIRQIQSIVNTQPGIINTPAGVTIRGGRMYETGFLVDGVSARDPLAGTGFGIDIGSNSINDIDINTSGATADVGDATSGVINARTRSGGDSTEISILYKRDNFGFNKNSSSTWNSQVAEFAIGGPTPWLSKKNPKRIRYFTSLRSYFTDNYTRNAPNQEVSSMFPQKWVTPYQDNRWSGLFKMNYDINKSMRLSLTYNKTVTVNQDVNMLRITGNDLPFTPGYQFPFQLQPDNANTFTHSANLAILNFKHLLTKRFAYEVTFSRFFARLRADANGRPWRPLNVDAEFDPNSITSFPVEYYNPGDSVVFVNPPPGLVNNGGIATLWHDHYIEEYTLKSVGTLYSKNSLNKLMFGFEFKFQEMQWIDIGRPWIGAPIQLANGSTSQSFRLGEYSEIWKVNPSRGGIFFSDRIKYRGLIADIGSRLEYWMPGKYVDDAIADPRAQIRDEIRTDYRNSTTQLFGRGFKFRFLPKISASFPISENKMLYFNYSHSTIVPHPSYVYTGLNPYYSDRSTVARLGNPNLNPEVTIAYEIALKTQITNNDALTVSAYWKDNYDFVTTTSILVKDVTGRDVARSMRINSDYARIRGVEVGYLKRIGKWYQGQFSVSYMEAVGQSSSASQSLKEILNQGAREDTREFYMPWSTPWDVKTNHMFILNNKNGYMGRKWINRMTFYLEGTLRSGLRYTPYVYQGTEPVSGRPIYVVDPNPNSRYSKVGRSTFTVDFNFKKWWTVRGGVQLAWTIEITNLLNTKNSAIINPVTGRAWRQGDPVPTEWRDPSYLDPRDSRSFGTPPDNPARYMPQRHFMTGISVKF